jgi:glycosyltransferase involved in cell wall biosynthesis
MRILYFSPINTDVQKGDSIHFLEIGENLQHFGNKLLVVCRGGKSKLRNLNFKYIPNIEIKYLTTLLVDLFSSLYLIFYLLVLKPDIVYYRGVTLGGIISRLFNVPSVAEANGIYPDEIKIGQPYFFKFVGCFLRLRERMNYFLANRIICVTEGIKRELVKNYGVKNVICKVIPNGANTTLFKPMDKIACRRKLGLKEDYFYLGFVGSFRSWVGLDTLIEAVSVIKEKGYERIRCILVGDESSMGHLKEGVNRHNLQEEIVFIGDISYEEVAVFVNSFDVCLAPFKRERNIKIGLSPLKLYEYLACARAVIASRLQGISEIISDGKCGYLFEPDDVEDLASRIIESYSERDKLNELGDNGRTLVEKRFSWEEIARRVESVLREALEVNSKN